MNPACRASSRAISWNSSVMSLFDPRRFISLYSTQPENSAVQEEIRKSMNSAFSLGSIPSQSTSSQSAFLRKWPLLGSAFI
jgi:hypothetical protein